MNYLSDITWIAITAAVVICSLYMFIMFKVKSARQERDYRAEGIASLICAGFLFYSFIYLPEEAVYVQVGVVAFFVIIIGIPVANSQIKKQRKA